MNYKKSFDRKQKRIIFKKLPNRYNGFNISKMWVEEFSRDKKSRRFRNFERDQSSRWWCTSLYNWIIKAIRRIFRGAL